MDYEWESMSWQNIAATEVMSLLFLEIDFVFSEALLRKYIEGIRNPVLTECFYL